MIEIEVPKDIRKYEAKLIGAFTARQAGCLVAACAICVPVFFLLREAVPRDVLTLLIMILAIPFVFLSKTFLINILWLVLLFNSFPQSFYTWLHDIYSYFVSTLLPFSKSYNISIFCIY